MAVKNNLPGVKTKPKFSIAIQSDAYKNLINRTLGDPERAKRFVASVSSAVATNPTLQECDAGTILTSALLGESLNLSPSPQLGQYYMVPFECKLKNEQGKTIYLTDGNGDYLKDGRGRWLAATEKRAQFVLGYKGYIQLAIRSGQYKRLNVMEIKEGELLHYDPLSEDIECRLIDDWETREAAPTIGYYAMFEYVNGFRKAIYWSRQKMEAHADRYSPAFNLDSFHKLQAGEIPEKEMWRYSSFWYKNFDDMAKKTMLRQLISRWGVMSIELQRAYESDAAVIRPDDTLTPEYVDNTPEEDVQEPTAVPAEEMASGEDNAGQPEDDPVEDFFS